MSGEDEQVLTQRKPEAEEAAVEPEEKKPEEPATETPATESRVGRFLRGAADSMPEGVKNAMHALAPVADAVHNAFVIAWPYIIAAYRKGKAVYDRMPEYSVVMIYGLTISFCGAHFAALVAVVEAFKQSGAFKKIGACLVDLYESFQKLHAENAKDNEVMRMVMVLKMSMSCPMVSFSFASALLLCVLLIPINSTKLLAVSTVVSLLQLWSFSTSLPRLLPLVHLLVISWRRQLISFLILSWK